MIFTYDVMGNILTQKRHLRNRTQIEDRTYRYQYDAQGKLIRNRLYHVNDNISASVDNTDIDDQGIFRPHGGTYDINLDNNYSYDEEGRLINDLAEEIDKIEWTVAGKVKSIKRLSPSSKKKSYI